MSPSFSNRICFKMTTDGSVSGSLFDSCSLYFVLLFTGKGGAGRRGGRGEAGIAVFTASVHA